MREHTLCVALTTTANLNDAQRLAHALVEAQLAACVNIVGGMRSIYRWQGKVEETAETMLVMKTSRESIAAIEALFKEMHSYDLPELLVLPVEGGSAAYLGWVRAGLLPE